MRARSEWWGVLGTALMLLVTEIGGGRARAAATLPSRDEIAGVQTACGGGYSEKIVGNVSGKLDLWRRSAAADGKAAYENLVGLFSNTPTDRDVNAENYRTYTKCILDILKEYLHVSNVSGSQDGKIREYLGNIEQAVLAGKRNMPETDTLYWQPFLGFIRGPLEGSDVSPETVSAIHHFKEAYQSLPPAPVPPSLPPCKPEVVSQAKVLVFSCMNASSLKCKAQDFDALRNACQRIAAALPEYNHR